MVDIQKVGAFIAQCRKEHNWTQKELGEKLGVTDKAISKWENGRLNGKYQKNILLILSVGTGIVQCRKLYSSGSSGTAGKENQAIPGSS